MPDSSWANATLDPGYPIASASAVLAIPVASLISPDAARWDMTRSRVPTARSLLAGFTATRPIATRLIATRLLGDHTYVPHVSSPLLAAIMRVNALHTAIMPDRWLTLFIIVCRGGSAGGGRLCRAGQQLQHGEYACRVLIGVALGERGQVQLGGRGEQQCRAADLPEEPGNDVEILLEGQHPHGRVAVVSAEHQRPPDLQHARGARARCQRLEGGLQVQA